MSSQFSYKDFPIIINDMGQFQTTYNDKAIKASSLSALKAKISNLLDAEVKAFKALVFHTDYNKKNPKAEVKEITIIKRIQGRYYTDAINSGYYESDLYNVSQRKQMVKYLANKTAEHARRETAAAKLKVEKEKLVPAIVRT